MHMIPQPYPLELDTENGDRHIVIGWTGCHDARDPAQVATMRPIAVPAHTPSAHPIVVMGAVTYRRPA